MAKISRHPASPLLNRADLGMVSVGEGRGEAGREGNLEGRRPKAAAGDLLSVAVSEGPRRLGVGRRVG